MYIVRLLWLSDSSTRSFHLCGPGHPNQVWSFKLKTDCQPKIFLRFFMMGLDLWTGAGTLGLDGIYFLADIGLAAGAKMEVRDCINIILRRVLEATT